MSSTRSTGSGESRAGGRDRRLRPTERVQRPSEFQRVLKSGRCFRDPVIRIHFIENRRELSRLGLVVSKKMGNAVARNRLKRIFREIFRDSKSRFLAPLDVVLVPDRRAGAKDRSSYAEAFDRFIAWHPRFVGQGRKEKP